MLFQVEPPQFLDPTEYPGELVVQLPQNLLPHPERGLHQPTVQYFPDVVGEVIEPFEIEESTWSFFRLSPPMSVQKDCLRYHRFLCSWMSLNVYVPHIQYVKITLKDIWTAKGCAKRFLILESQHPMLELFLGEVST